ncbi:hypothetical protein MKX08_000870 [Trichoderma sp. CBMAI-0020]|nr:hypothetical protein MKX08_000870 [Trichoderma sp. CBMAI-0020]
MPPSSSSSKPPPLPLAPDRAAISNKISLLLSSRTSLLKTLNPPSSSAASQTTTPRRHHQAISSDDIEQLFSGPRPNEGVGYVPDAKAAAGKDAASREDRMLRGRLLGKGKGGRNQKGGRGFAVESESDEEPGRSGLGKRKRPRREEVAVADEEVVDGGDEEKLGDVEMGDDGREDAALVEDENAGSGGNDDDDDKRERNRKEKKRKKRLREKQKQKQKQASPGS